MITSLAGMAYGQWGIRKNPDDTAATAIFLASCLAAALLHGKPMSFEPPKLHPPARRLPLIRAAALVAVATGILAIGAGSAALVLDWRGRQLAGWALVVLGTAVLSAACRLLDPPREGDPAWSRGEALALTAIFALGAALRFHRYAEFPGPFTLHAVEEPQTGMGGYKVFAYGARPWEFLLDHYLAGLAIFLTGDRSMLSVRIPFTMFSTLTILPVHLLLRHLAPRPAALAGTFLFAVSSWNLVYSRCAHNIFLTNFFVVLVLALLFAYARTRRLGAMPWVGLFSAYTLYAYAGYRGTLLFVLVFLIGLLAVDLRRFTRAIGEEERLTAARAVLRGIGATAMVVYLGLALGAPIYAQVANNPAQPNYYFEAAIRSLSNRQYYTRDPRGFFEQRLRRIRNTARIFMHVGDDSPTFNAPNEPMVDPLTSCLFAAGLLGAACYPRRGYNAFLIFMFLSLLFGGAVFVQNLDVRRLQGITPFVAAFATLFLGQLWAAASFRSRTAGRAALCLLAAAGGIFALARNYDVYFRKMAGDPRVRQAFRNQYVTLIHYGQVHLGAREMWLLSDVRNLFIPSDYWWMVEGAFQGRSLPDAAAVLSPPQQDSGSRRVTVVVQEPLERRAVAALVRALYPAAACSEFAESETPHLALTACHLPERAIPVPVDLRLEARYWLGERNGVPALQRLEPFIGFANTPPICYGREIHPEAETCIVQWYARLPVQQSGIYTFRIAKRGAAGFAQFQLDGMPLRDGERRLLGAGEHDFTGHARIPRGSEAGVRLEWAAGSEFTAVPFYTTAAPTG